MSLCIVLQDPNRSLDELSIDCPVSASGSLRTDVYLWYSRIRQCISKASLPQRQAGKRCLRRLVPRCEVLDVIQLLLTGQPEFVKLLLLQGRCKVDQH